VTISELAVLLVVVCCGGNI